MGIHFETYLKLTKKSDSSVLAGGSCDDTYENAIEILAFQHAMYRTVNTQMNRLRPQHATASLGINDFFGMRAAATTVLEHAPLTVLKPIDEASPQLQLFACKYKSTDIFSKAELFVYSTLAGNGANLPTYSNVITITLTDVYISRMEVRGDPMVHPLPATVAYPIASSGALVMGPVEEIDLSYKKFQIKVGTKTSTQLARESA